YRSNRSRPVTWDGPTDGVDRLSTRMGALLLEDPRHPCVQFLECPQGQRRGGTEPTFGPVTVFDQHHVIVRGAVGRRQPLPHGEGVVTHVQITVGQVVLVETVVHDRDVGQTTTPVQHTPAAVGGRCGQRIGHGSVPNHTTVPVHPAHVLVEVQELVHVEHTVQQRPQTVLHPHVVQRPAWLSGPGVGPVHV